jgi:hypothetical protein
MRINFDGGALRLPFSLVSDGTAKWFTLVTAIVTNLICLQSKSQKISYTP